MHFGLWPHGPHAPHQLVLLMLLKFLDVFREGQVSSDETCASTLKTLILIFEDYHHYLLWQLLRQG